MGRWALSGFLTAFGVLAILSVGLPFFLAGLILTAMHVARGRTAGAPAGLAAAGAAATAFLLVTGTAEAVSLVLAATAGWTAVAAAAGWLAGRARRIHPAA